MRKYFLELFAIGLVDSEGRINTEHMTSDALMTAMKTMEELTKMKMDRLVLETTMEMILCMFESLVAVGAAAGGYYLKVYKPKHEYDDEDEMEEDENESEDSESEKREVDDADEQEESTEPEILRDEEFDDNVLEDEEEEQE